MEPTERAWQATMRKVRNRLGHVLESIGEFPADVQFKVGRPGGEVETIGAHKLILAAGSEVMYAMFYGLVADKKETIEITDLHPSAFRQMLRFLTPTEFTWATMVTMSGSFSERWSARGNTTYPSCTSHVVPGSWNRTKHTACTKNRCAQASLSEWVPSNSHRTTFNYSIIFTLTGADVERPWSGRGLLQLQQRMLSAWPVGRGNAD
ncbi:hypothetical protein RvY_11319-2 [Ramazzottius varieornatus]|uniref:BTB domain-containing protein n=1 Tax=Ramazzottius varieornatus TaxID=947166 RepID=A0A1D1VFP2_RAMVA|nr:hypothetical protein RvY_11319-2 [Ramazzottius varieornatus]